jgi:hypothetical protein
VGSIVVGTDIITGGLGGDMIYPDGGRNIVILPPGHGHETVVFGEDQMGNPGNGSNDILAITDGSDNAYLGSWGVGTMPVEVPILFGLGIDTSGGTSDDITGIIDFRIGSGPGHDQLDFTAAAWNGASVNKFLGIAETGDLVNLDGISVVSLGAAQLSTPWTNSGSNSLLKTTDNVLLYAPFDASPLRDSRALAAQLQTASDAVVLPGHIGAGDQMHILVAYDASDAFNNYVNIADVDLVNTTASNQSSTANLHVYASDMVSLVGVPLASLAAANIQFI